MNLETFPWATAVMVVLVAIAAGVGGAVVIAGNMTFQDYLDQVAKFAGAVGLLAVGRGIIASKK
jgi:hypothetical protein